MIHNIDTTEGVLIVAVYGAEGELVGFKTGAIPEKDGSVEIELSSVVGAEDAKAFIWDSLDGTKPMSKTRMANIKN